MRSVIDLGGIKKDIPAEVLSKLAIYLKTFVPQFESAIKDVNASSSLIDRFSTTGILKKKFIVPLNLTGPIARAAGASYDVRLDHPYGIYKDKPPERATKTTGDVLSRFKVKAAEILNSATLIQELIASIPEAQLLLR